jgi:hypothetical protein
MGIGNLALLLIGLLILERNAFSVLDAIYWLVVIAVLMARLMDIRRFGGRTIDNEPASMHHFRRYVLKLPLVAAGFWAFAHILPLVL